MLGYDSRRSIVGLLAFASILAPTPPPVAATPACAHPGNGWCVARRITGDIPGGELGFRFGEPLDVDGDGSADIAAGARFKLDRVYQNGTAGVWSGATGASLRIWDGTFAKGLFGHCVLPMPDLGDDGLADVVISAPAAEVDGETRGVLTARSPKTGETLWERTGRPNENFGWDLAAAADDDGDGRSDIVIGAPAADRGHVYLVSGRTGATLRTFAPDGAVPSFGWYVAAVDDLDGDGFGDLAAGAFQEKGAGAAYVFSSRGARQLRRWEGPEDGSGFGEIVAAIGDLDGDGHGEVIISAPRSADPTRTRPGDVTIYSGATGKKLHHWTGAQPGELFGRMVVACGDLDGDSIEDVAIGAPWHRREGNDKVGRIELRSGRGGEVLFELFGDDADSWFGWHIRRAPDPAGRGRPAVLVSSLRHPVNGKAGVGVLDLLVLRSERDGATPRATP